MPANIAVVGNGYWGRNLIRNFYDLGALGGICDSSADAETAARTRYPEIRLFCNYQDVLSAPEISAVVLATPAATHYALAKEALESGKDVLVEKPLSLHVFEAAELLELAHRHERILMVGHILQYHPAVRKLKELIQSGALGRIQYLYSNRLNMGKIRTEENILWSFAPHDISVMLGLLGEDPKEISCNGDYYLSRSSDR
jgi:UDP-2-acetamido-3-amino-2,3-dideoxy-glucuronate N-acetyltransferase